MPLRGGFTSVSTPAAEHRTSSEVCSEGKFRALTENLREVPNGCMQLGVGITGMRERVRELGGGSWKSYLARKEPQLKFGFLSKLRSEHETVAHITGR